MRKIIFIMVILLLVAVSGCIEQEIEGKYKINYQGVDFLFNSNLEKAENVTVIPNESAIIDTLFDYNVAELNLAYYENDTEAPLYIKSLMSFISKYKKMNLIVWSYDFDERLSYTILTEDGQMPNATMEAPSILLMGPAFSDSTRIEVENNIVKIYASDLTPRKGGYADYTDFDLALDKIILVLMKENTL